MKKTVILLTLIVAICLGGCTVMESPAERGRRYAHITDLNLRMIGDDWDMIWLYDHNSQLTQWHPYIGS